MGLPNCNTPIFLTKSFLHFIKYTSKKEEMLILQHFLSLNEASGIRTPDNLIKSQVLYRLS